jgi:hypothetical protein
MRWTGPCRASTVGMLALAACTGNGPTGTDAVVTDSAGVRVVVNPRSPATLPSEWRLQDPPVLEIGVVDGPREYQLFQVQSGTVLSDGTVVVAEGSSREIRYYDNSGRHLRSAGRLGDGPGEFQSAVLIGAFGADSLLIWDLQLRRASVFDRSGTFVRSFVPASGGDLTQPVLAGVLFDGMLIVRHQPVYSPGVSSPGVNRPEVVVYVAGSDGTLETRLGEFPGSEALVATTGLGPMVTDVTFGRGLHLSAVSDRVAVANDDAYSVRIYDGRGRLLHVVRQDRDLLAIREEDFQQVRQAMLENAATPAPVRAAFEQALDQMPRHTTFPAFASIRLDRMRNLWVEERRPPGVTQPIWQVFDSEGFLVARVRTPEGFQVLDIDEDYVLGLFRDELGVESLRLYRLDRNIS